MSRSKIFNMIKTRGTQTNSRNTFDLGNAHAYSQKAGTITPLKALHVIPDDFLNISIRDFTQTFPMMSAPFLKARKELSAYFVPYNSLWHNYNQYQATREDPQSSLLQERGIVYEPRMALYDAYGIPFYSFLYYLIQEYFYIPYADQVGQVPESGQEVARQGLATALADASLVSLDDGDNPFYRPFEILEDVRYDQIEVEAVIKDILGTSGSILGDLSSEYWYLDASQSWSGTPEIGYFADGRKTYKEVYQDVVGNYTWCDILRKFDMLGYGNLYPMFNACLESIVSAYDDFLSSRSAASYTAFKNRVQGQLTLLRNNLAYMSSSVPITSTSGQGVRGKNVFVSPLPLFAYNKIFYDYYRNTYYDDKYHIRNYNCDFVFSGSVNGSIITSYMLPARFWNLETHQYKKDMFTAVMPSTQFGAVSVLPLSGSFSTADEIETDGLSNYLTSDGFVASGSASFSSGELLGSSSTRDVRHTHTISSITVGGSVSLNPLELKRVEALQQFRQDLLRAGNRTEDIFKQIYGTEPKSQLSEKPYFIDAVSNDFNVNPVISTADTQQGENGSLGDIASRAISSTAGDGLSSKFSTEDFGVIIILSTIIPESMYNSTLIDPHLTNLSPEEHFIPHFQNLGFEPLYRMYLNNVNLPSVRTNVIGFSLPYLEFKTDVDLAHGAFACLNTKRPDSVVLDYNVRGSLAHWVVARTDMQNSVTTMLANFYINPSVLDTIFVQESGADYESDQFICYTQIDCPAVRQLTELGLPNFL